MLRVELMDMVSLAGFEVSWSSNGREKIIEKITEKETEKKRMENGTIFSFIFLYNLFPLYP